MAEFFEVKGEVTDQSLEVACDTLYPWPPRWHVPGDYAHAKHQIKAGRHLIAVFHSEEGTGTAYLIETVADFVRVIEREKTREMGVASLYSCRPDIFICVKNVERVCV